MTSWNGRVVFVDGFAGPGKYRGGEEGSPVIALKAALEHTQPIRSEVVFHFIEHRRDRFEYLRNLLSEMFPNLPSNIVYHVHNRRFDETLCSVLTALDEQGRGLAPTFAFIDPFGYSDTPFSVISRIMTNPRCEVLINFNYEELNRFTSVPSQSQNFDKQFGTGAWRECKGLRRLRSAKKLYSRDLQDSTGTGCQDRVREIVRNDQQEQPSRLFLVLWHQRL